MALLNQSLVECHRPQCVPAFFNVALDELRMPAPFRQAIGDPDAESAEDRARLKAWCESLQIRYFPE